MREENYYELFGVDEEASDQEIKQAYRDLIKRYHPDTYRGDTAYAEEQTRLINEAYSVLSNSRSREEYDMRIGAAGRRIVQEQIRRHGEEARARPDAEAEWKRREAIRLREEQIRRHQEEVRRRKTDRILMIGAVVLVAAAVLGLLLFAR